MSLADELAKLHQLKEEGALTDAEYQHAKQRLLDGDDDAPESLTPPPAPTHTAAPLAEALTDFVEEDNSLGRAANRYVTYRENSTVIGLVVFVIVVIIFAVIFLAAKNDMDRHFNQHAPFPQLQDHAPFGR